MLDVALWPHQFDAVFNIDEYRLVCLIGGRGAGKSYTDKVRVIRWAEMTKELPIGVFAATDTMLNTVLAPIKEAVTAMGIKTVYAGKAPRKWRARWKRRGINVPPPRLRNLKFWIWEDGTHIYTGTLVNNSYTRAKGIDFNAILIQEGTEPGVYEEAIDTLIATLRCGKARKQDDGSWRCVEPGHLHQLVFVANVPLNDPSHWIRKKVRRLQAREDKRKQEGKRPYFRLIQQSTEDNPSTGDDYIEGLAAGWDERTFREQTSGSLEVNAAVTSYYSFSEQNIHAGLVYDPNRPLHMWFDYNTTPAAVGWGHDLIASEVPGGPRAGQWYFGIHGELFSGAEPMVTSQVAHALLEDPQTDARCRDCGDMLSDHMHTARGELCRRCAWMDKGTGRHCAGVPIAYEAKRGIIKAPANWRGLINHRGKIFIYGDATGGATHADSEQIGGSIRILRDVFGSNLGERCLFRIPKVNPSIRLRVLAMNRAFCARNGVRELYVAPWCEAHIADFREVVPDPKTGEPLKVSKAPSSRKRNEYWLRTDASDGAGYHVAFRRPAIQPRDGSIPPPPDHEDYGPFADLPEPESRLRRGE